MIRLTLLCLGQTTTSATALPQAGSSGRSFKWHSLRSRLSPYSTNSSSSPASAPRPRFDSRLRDTVAAGEASGHGTSGATEVQARRFTLNWRYYAAQFKEKPGSHLTAFLLLHEFTAVAPLGLVYYGLSWSDVHIPFPQSVLDESNAKIKRVIKYYGWDIEPDSRVMVNMVAAYGIVKMMLPLRIGISVFFTPSLAKVIDRVVLPLRNRVHGMLGKK